ncbi:MAG TPA: cache domain-containing protein, partial [Burkholderiaceae bacterium]|nr:cache domain-containing protein [Burkholderiaceae bacterium]
MNVFRLSLRTAIAVPFALLFAATVALQAITQQQQISHLIDQESVRLLDAITATSRNRLVEFLDEPFRIQRDIADAIGRHSLYKEGDLKPIYDHLRGVYQDLYLDRHQISLLSFGSQAGEYAGMRREVAGFKLILKDASTHGMMNVYRDDTAREVAAAFPGYDPRGRPWYAPVAASGKPGWSAIYTVAGERGDVTISAATPVRAGNKLIGVAEADVRLDSLNQFLRSEPLRGKGLIFITDRDGRLVAHSEAGSVVSQGSGALRRGERLLMSESATPQIRAAAQYALRAPVAGGLAFRLNDSGEMYFGRVTPYADARGIDWRIVALVPESYLLGDVRDASRRSMLGVIGIALLGLLLGLWIIQRVTRPILMTAAAANKLARGEWKPGIDKGSGLQETTILLRAFNEMAQRLQQSFNQMREQLMYDSLTQLLTRRGLLEQAAWTEPRRAVLTLVGLDAFRAINDSVGHGTGDR